MPDIRDGHTKTTRPDEMLSRWPHEEQDGLMNSIRKCTFARPSGNFLTCQRFWRRSRSCCRSLRKSTGDHTMAYDALTIGPMFSRLEPNLKISIIVFPSCVNFGTV